MKALEDVVLFKTDAEKEGKEMKAEYLVQGYPTFVLVNADGEVLDTWSGYAKEFFLQLLAPAVADPTTIDEKTARFAANPSANDGLRVARYHATRGAYDTALEFVEATGELDDAPDLAATRFDYLSSGFLYKDLFDAGTVRKAADAVVASDAATPDDLVNVEQGMASVGRKVEDPELRIAYLTPAFEATRDSENESLARMHTRLAVDHALLVEKAPAKAVELRRELLPEGWKEDPSALNGFAWWCFEGNVNLDEALVLARRGAELAAPGKERAMILDTAAEICNAQGNCDDAVELIRQAVEEAPDTEYYQEQLQRFQDVRAASAN